MNRSTPLKRTPFRPQGYAPREPKVYEAHTPRARAVAVCDGKARMVVPVSVPKAEKAKPGKATPTVEERAWLDWIVDYGCIACRLDCYGVVPPAVHHILRGGVRMGHLFSLPLCPGHHQDGTGASGFIARHPWKARFERRYGTESELLASLQTEYATRATRRNAGPWPVDQAQAS